MKIKIKAHIDLHIYFHESAEIHDTTKYKLDLILKQQEKLMSKITDFATAANTALETASTALDNIAGDVKNLSDQIKALSDQIANGDSTLTPEAQAALDSVLLNANTLAQKAQGQAESVPDLPPPPQA